MTPQQFKAFLDERISTGSSTVSTAAYEIVKQQFASMEPLFTKDEVESIVRDALDSANSLIGHHDEHDGWTELNESALREFLDKYVKPKQDEPN